jgi:hypothetical protein
MLIVLTYAVSLSIKPSFKLNIYNQCLNIDLVSPTYFTNFWLECHGPPNYKVCVGDTVRSSFIINKPGNEYYGALIYRLQRKQIYESTEMNEDTSSVAHLLVFWATSKFNELHADVLLVEHDKEFNWNKDDLRKLYDRHHDQLEEYDNIISVTWFMDDNIILKATFKINGPKETFDLNISISEAEKCDYAIRPIWVNTKR